MKPIIEIIAMAYFIISSIGFIIGMMIGGQNEICEYKSILSATNIGYFVGCELVIPRF